MGKFSVMLLFVLIIQSCSVEPIPILYGKDECELCRMKIIEKGYGAELLTKKGRAYKFDSIECLLSFVKKGSIDSGNVKSLLVIDHAVDGNLINVKSAYFLHSDQLLSPMGAGLTSFANLDSLNAIRKIYSGDILSWDQLLITNLK